MDGVRKFVAWILDNHPDAHGEIKRHRVVRQAEAAATTSIEA